MYLAHFISGRKVVHHWMLSGCIGGLNKYDLTNFYSRPPVKDTSELSLSDFCALAKTPLKRNRFGKSRGPADALRTVCWYRYLTCETPDISAYAQGKLVEPSAYKVDIGAGRRIHTHTNKWIRYARGRAVPQGALIAAADLKYPGSAAAINHPVWLLTDRQFSSQGQLTKVKSLFSPQVQIEIDAASSLPTREAPRLAIFDVKKLVLLEPLDALGAIIYLLWEAKLRADTCAQAGWVICAYNALLIHGADLRSCGVARPLFELLRQNLLGAIEHDGVRFDYPSSHYLLSVELLVNFYTSQQLRHGKNRRQFIYDTVASTYGIAPAIITWPIRVPVGECPSVAAIERFEEAQRIFSWALFALANHELLTELPDDALIDSFPLVFVSTATTR